MDLGRNINLKVIYIILVDKFMQTSLAVKVYGVYISFFILILIKAKALRLLII